MLFKTQSPQLPHHHRVLLHLIYVSGPSLTLGVTQKGMQAQQKGNAPFFVCFGKNVVPARAAGLVLFFSSVSNSCSALLDQSIG